MNSFNKILFKFSIIFSIICEIRCDCGIPAIPVHMKVRPFTSVYSESDIIEYYCEYNDMNLIGTNKRQCLHSRWKGDIPLCVREIPRHALERIESTVKIHTITTTYTSNLLSYESVNHIYKDYDRYQRMTFYGNYIQSPNECIHSTVKSKVAKLSWNVVFKWRLGQVYQVTVVVATDNIHPNVDVNKTESVISGVFTSDYRDCRAQTPQAVDVNERLIKYTFICELKDIESKQSSVDWNAFHSENPFLSIAFALQDIVVCELHVSETMSPLITSGSCGSPDIPLYATYEPVYDEGRQVLWPVGYKFECEQGFKLTGNQVVLCGMNNKWKDPFPTCAPTHKCLLMNKTRMNELKLVVNYHNLFSFDDNITAINGTQAVYSCAQHNDTLLGDSVQFCQISGNWSGEDPVCTERDVLALYWAELKEDRLKKHSKLPQFVRHQHRPNDCGIPAIPKYAKIFTYDPDLLNIHIASILGRIDLLPKYTNGSVITYHCESMFTSVGSDFTARTCANGSWIGPIGKCYPPVGGTEVARLVSLQEIQGSAVHSYHPISSTKVDKYWSYSEENGEACVKLDVQHGKKYTWSLYFSQSVKLSYFAIKLMSAKIFHEYEEDVISVHRAQDLDKESPISADIYAYNNYGYNSKLECELTKVVEMGQYGVSSNGYTQLSFKCDDPLEQHSLAQGQQQPHSEPFSDMYAMKSSSINLHIDSDHFHENFNETHIKFCGLMLFESSDDCGLPENVPNGEIVDRHTGAYVKYGCNNGYSLVGNEFVRCHSGHWLDPFPRCELQKLCEMSVSKASDKLQRVFFNTLTINGKEEAVLGTIVEYRCSHEDLTHGHNVMIGPRTAVCTESGKWSANEPICADDTFFTRPPNPTAASHTIPWVAFCLVLGVLIAVVLPIVLVYRRFGCSNSLITLLSRRRQTRRSSTFISYGQTIRDSVVSYNSGNSSANNNNTINANLIKI